MHQYGIVDYRVNPEDEFSFYALASQLELQCKSRAQIGWVGSFIFIGWAIGCIFIPPYADKNGRKGVFLMALSIQFFTWIFILNCPTIQVMYGLSFLFGVCIAGRYTVGYVFLVESMPKAYQVRIGLLVDVFETAILIWITLYLSFVSKNWLGIQMFALTVNVLGLFLCFFLIKESPRYLLETGRNEHAYINLKFIAMRNG